MGLWSKLFRRGMQDTATPVTPAATAPASGAGNTVDLPAEPYVFECQQCGKVFEARRKRPQCPECDSTEVSLLSE